MKTFRTILLWLILICLLVTLSRITGNLVRKESLLGKHIIVYSPNTGEYAVKRNGYIYESTITTNYEECVKSLKWYQDYTQRKENRKWIEAEERK